MNIPQSILVLLIGAPLAVAAPLEKTPAPAQVASARSTAAPKNAEVFKTLPKGAKLIPRAEHEKLLRNNEAFLISKKAERDRLARAEAATFARRQKAAHAALKNNPKAIAELNAIPEYAVDVRVDTLSGPRDFVELGRRDLIEMIASSAELPSNRINAREAYRFAYEILPSSKREKFTVPDEIDNFTLLRIKQDTATMMKVSSLLNRDTTKRALSNAAAWEPRNDGQDKDTDQQCIDRDFDPNGLMRKFDFALKPHLGRARDQRSRATCWAFAAVAAIEANAHKNTGNWHNLSEQDLIMHHKLKWNPAPNHFKEGDSSGRVLNMAFEKDYRFVVESQLEYNPSLKREPDKDATPPYRHSCDEYGPDCSDTNHQAVQVCSQFGLGQQWCTYWTLGLHRTTFVSRRVADIWKSADQDGALQDLRTTLESGTPVILGFSITPSWSTIRPHDPYMSLPASPETKSGGHYVLIVGYIPREEVAAAGIPAGMLNGVDDDWIIIKNSYGRCWGDAGYGYIPAEQLKRIFAIVDSEDVRVGVLELFVVPTPVTL